jgi:2-dehydro-3-deoxy-D-arabinonate dehydratase
VRIIRYNTASAAVALAAVTDEGKLVELPQQDFLSVVKQAKAAGQTTLQYVQGIVDANEGKQVPWQELELLTPLDAPEVWAAGVTYEKSREARNYEATGGKMDASTFYDKVYDAVRPEIFFKSTAARTVGPGQAVQLRSDSEWQIPEPELALVLDGEGTILGYTIGNDMSCRDIEGENPLYLPQAKMWKRSCSIGPAIRLTESVDNPYDFQITCRIFRNGEQVKRKLEELVSFLKLDNELFEGTVLLTGTCIVPPNEFSLASGDRVDIEISGIGVLSNPVQAAQ